MINHKLKQLLNQVRSITEDVEDEIHARLLGIEDEKMKLGLYVNEPEVKKSWYKRVLKQIIS